MKEVSKTDGRTVLFVSHNVNAIESLSHRCILLESGRIVAAGCATGTVASYLDAMASKAEPRLRFSRDASPDKIAAIEWVELSGRDQSSNRNGIFDFSDRLRLEIQYRLLSEVVGFHCAIELYAGTQVVFTSFDTDRDPELLNRRAAGVYRTVLVLQLPRELLKSWQLFYRR